jgi:hypothetical protein
VTPTKLGLDVEGAERRPNGNSRFSTCTMQELFTIGLAGYFRTSRDFRPITIL